ncbi:MAG: histidine phosphatase family protein [Acidimicrobiia bacterium]
MSHPIAGTRFLLVRHGQSTWNADGRWQGQANPPLTELGERQAFDAAARVGMVDAVYASDLERAARTAEIIAGQLGADVMVDPRLRERHAGPWEGHTKDEIEAEWPGMLASGERPLGYEGDVHVIARALVSLGEIAGMHEGGDVLVVTHGGVVRALERHLDADDGLLPNLGGRWITWGPAGPVLGERVELIPEDEITRPEQI